jgi:hypothetical protein
MIQVNPGRREIFNQHTTVSDLKINLSLGGARDLAFSYAPLPQGDKSKKQGELFYSSAAVASATQNLRYQEEKS